MTSNENKNLPRRVNGGWNPIGWFGVVAGASAWMLFTGIFLVSHGDWATGSIPASTGLVTLIIGFVVWMNRSRLSVNQGLMILLGVTLAATLIAIPLTIQHSPPQLLSKLRWPANPVPLLTCLTLLLGSGIWHNYKIDQQTGSKENPANHFDAGC